MERILVTGGAGFVGSLLVPQLLQRGYDVRVFDWMLFAPQVFDAVRCKALEVVKGDLRDATAVEAALQGVETVIHLGCLSNDPSCDLDETLTRAINYDAGVRLIQLAKKNGVRRFLYASSASVYGIKEEQEVTEELALAPLTSYARCKADLEAFLLSELAPSFRAVIVRPATLCGCAPRQRFDITVNTMTYEAVRKNKITLFNAQQERPNLTVQDMVAVYLLLLSTPMAKINGEIFNVTAKNYRVIELAQLVKDTLAPLPIEIETVSTNDQRSYRLSGEKIQRVLGYTPKYTVRDAIRDLAQALQTGQIPDPESTRYRNLQFLRENFSLWAHMVS